MQGSHYRQILDELSAEQNFTLRWLSDDYVGILEKDSVRRLLVWNDLGLNSSTARAVACDKYATYSLLKQDGIPVIEHFLLFQPNLDECLADVNEYFMMHGQHIVIKDNEGCNGDNVFEIREPSEIPEAIIKCIKHSESAVVCPFYDIKFEYRLVVLDERVRLAFCKQRGKDWRFNLRYGAKVSDVKPELLEQVLTPLALAAAKSLTIRFCSVDVIETTDGEFLVLEVNSRVFMEKYLDQRPDEYKKVKQIYNDAIKKILC